MSIMRAGAETQAEGEAGSREPDAGLNPRSPGSRPGTEGSTKPLGHWGCLISVFLVSRIAPGSSNV